MTLGNHHRETQRPSVKAVSPLNRSGRRGLSHSGGRVTPSLRLDSAGHPPPGRRLEPVTVTIPTGLMALYRTPANPVALADRAQRRAGSYAASIRTRLAVRRSCKAGLVWGQRAPHSAHITHPGGVRPKLCHGSRAAGARSQLSAFRLSRCCASVSASRAPLRVTDAKTPFGPDTRLVDEGRNRRFDYERPTHSGTIRRIKCNVSGLRTRERTVYRLRLR